MNSDTKMKPDLLCFRDLLPLESEIIGQHYTIHLGVTPQARREQMARLGPSLRAVMTIGETGLTNVEMGAMPQLGIVCFSGSGHEGIDLNAARRRGIAVTNSPDANAASVADHALGLMLAVARRIALNDRAVRQGGWRDLSTLPGQLSGKRIGIIGLGNIGSKIAQRAAGFEMDIAYHNRHARKDIPYRWMESPLALAHWCDFLVLSAPGGAATRHMVNGAVIDALGTTGYLVNVGRGSLVDTQALIAALQDRRIAGAGLDVFEEEPNVPAALRTLPNVVLTPHLGAHSLESMRAKAEMVVHNLDAYFSGQSVLTPIDD